MTMAKVYTLVVSDDRTCMPKMEVEKLAGRNTMETSVSARTLVPCATAVRASRTAVALSSCCVASGGVSQGGICTLREVGNPEPKTRSWGGATLEGRAFEYGRPWGVWVGIYLR